MLLVGIAHRGDVAGAQAIGQSLGPRDAVTPGADVDDQRLVNRVALCRWWFRIFTLQHRQGSWINVDLVLHFYLSVGGVGHLFDVVILGVCLFPGVLFALTGQERIAAYPLGARCNVLVTVQKLFQCAFAGNVEMCIAEPHTDPERSTRGFA